MQDIEKFIRGFSRFQEQYLKEPTALDSLRQASIRAPWSSAAAMRASIRRC
ncbi:hypothetical protein [Massilia oculi]|uniref:hypothetical protein n=1 Tax=Massilia oculi TaxID=945844 RepID=UPI0028AFFAEC|nr:hypothetical protein [Massilia oculi]